MIEQLRQATKRQHADLDHAIFPLIQSIRTPEQYAELLRVFYGYFQPVYEKIDQFIDKSVLFDYDRRRKPAVLLGDLESIGATGSVPALCENIPSITNAAEAFGALYVLEGSTMGGKIISKKLMENTGLGEHCFKFFSGYGELNGQMWGIFAETLQHPSLASSASQLTDAAGDTFRLFHEWINLQYPGSKTAQKELHA